MSSSSEDEGDVAQDLGGLSRGGRMGGGQAAHRVPDPRNAPSVSLSRGQQQSAGTFPQPGAMSHQGQGFGFDPNHNTPNVAFSGYQQPGRGLQPNHGAPTGPLLYDQQQSAGIFLHASAMSHQRPGSGFDPNHTPPNVTFSGYQQPGRGLQPNHGTPTAPFLNGQQQSAGTFPHVDAMSRRQQSFGYFSQGSAIGGDGTAQLGSGPLSQGPSSVLPMHTLRAPDDFSQNSPTPPARRPDGHSFSAPASSMGGDRTAHSFSDPGHTHGGASQGHVTSSMGPDNTQYAIGLIDDIFFSYTKKKVNNLGLQEILSFVKAVSGEMTFDLINDCTKNFVRIKKGELHKYTL